MSTILPSITPDDAAATQIDQQRAAMVSVPDAIEHARDTA
jgi:hypothetical protein